MSLDPTQVERVEAPPTAPPLIDREDDHRSVQRRNLRGGDRPRRRSSMPRRTRTVGAMLLPLQLFLAAGWFRAGVEKVIDPAWWRGDTLLGFLDEQRGHMLPFFEWFTDTAVAPMPAVVAFVVAEMQLAIAICLLANRYVRPALWAAIVLNVTFTLAGAVNPSAFYLVIQVTLLLALSRPVSMTIAARRAVLWCIVGATMVPFIGTVEPAAVIDDPAAMLVFVTMLAAAGTVAPHRQALTELTLGKIRPISYRVNRPLRQSQV